MDNRLGARINDWRSIDAPEHVLNWICNGVPLPIQISVKPFHLRNHKLSKVQSSFISQEIKRLQRIGAIEVCTYAPVGINPLGCVPKKNNKLRLITDLRHINEHIKAPKFRNEDIQVTLDLVERNDACITADLKDCFFHIKVNEVYRDLLGFQWNNTFYRWKVLPFGLNISPYYCNKILRPVIHYLRSLDLRVQVFVDDFWLCATEAKIADHKDLLIHTLQDLGWIINWEKSSLVPSTTKEYLGWIVDSELLQVQATASRVKKLKRSLTKILNKQYITARQLARVAGQCVAMTTAVLPGKMMLRGVYHLLRTKDSWDSMLILNKRAEADLQWWKDSITAWNGRPIKKQMVDLQLETDASKIGWGARLLDKEASGTWSHYMSNQPSNVRELMAILLALLSFRDSVENKNVQVLTDNISALANLNKFGGPTLILTNISRALWNVAIKYNVNLSARHLSGRLNVEADRLSRIPDMYDWMLHPGMFKMIDRKYGPHTVDRFANLHNTQLQRYNSRFMDPFCEGVDALAQQNWHQENNYCNPPWRLIPQVLDIVTAQNAVATLLIPMWKSQPWYPKLRKMLVEQPMLLPSHPRLFLKMGATPEPLRQRRWKVAVCRISGMKGLQNRDGLSEPIKQ